MGETIYNFVSLFPKLKSDFNTLTQSVQFGGQFYCQEIKEHFSNNVESYEKICNKVYIYLNDLGTRYDDENYVRKKCKFLNYWLYQEIKNIGESKYNTLNLYQIFMKMDDGVDMIDNKLCNKHIEVLSKDTYDELKELDELFEELHNLQENSPPQMLSICQKATNCYTKYMRYKDKRHGNEKKSLRNELEKFRTQYNSFMKTQITCNLEQRSLPSFQESNVDLLLIPIVVILVTSFTLIIMYKFTPLGSWFYGRIKRKKNIRKFMNEEKEQFSYNSKIPNINSHKIQYNIAYIKS